MNFREGLNYVYKNRSSDLELTDPFLLYCRLSDLCGSSFEDKHKVLLFYQIDKKIKEKSNSEFREWLFDGIKKEITKMLPGIMDRIKYRDLIGHSFYFYIVPFEKLETNRQEILAKVVE